MKIIDVSILTKSTKGHSRASNRRGLAPLEMVMVLPLLMMIMSMIIVFGYMISWKLRTETVARDAIWRDRSDRFANEFATPIEWNERLDPTDPSIWTSRGNNIAEFENELETNHPIIAGPIPQVAVREQVLEFGRGVRIGVADLDEQTPIFSTLSPVQFRVNHAILDNQFRYWQLGHGNFQRRIPVIYEVELDFIRGSAAMQSAVAAIVNAPFQLQLVALDRDPEFLAWRGSAPDFHPRVGRFCETDRQIVRDNQVASVIRRISQLPQRMARASIRLYREQIDTQPDLPEAARQELQRRIDALEAWLETI